MGRDWWLYPLGVATGILFGMVIGGTWASNDFRDEATANNAAHWTIDPETGEREFVWGPKPKEDRDENL